VGGQLLFQGIQSMFGQHAGSILSGHSMRPPRSETVVNNFYGDQPCPSYLFVSAVHAALRVYS
jgi:hypothetical protein